MRLALVGWVTDSGVGRELIDAARNLPVTSVFGLHNTNKPPRTDLLSWLPVYMSIGQNPQIEMDLFLKKYKPDVVLSWESPGDWGFPRLWSQCGVKWVHVVHWDYFDPAHKAECKRGKLIAPNLMCQRELSGIGLGSSLLSVPVDTQRIKFKLRPRASKFVSVYGYGGPAQRRSLSEILEAWRMMKQPPPLIIRAQCAPNLGGKTVPDTIDLKVGNLPEPADLFVDGDIALQPSRYEGIGVTMLEAQAAGLPVMTMDGPPMNVIAPDLLVAPSMTEKIKVAGKEILSYAPSAEELQMKVNKIVGKDIAELSRQARKRMERLYSWKTLQGQWMAVLAA